MASAIKQEKKIRFKLERKHSDWKGRSKIVSILYIENSMESIINSIFICSNNNHKINSKKSVRIQKYEVLRDKSNEKHIYLKL